MKLCSAAMRQFLCRQSQNHDGGTIMQRRWGLVLALGLAAALAAFAQHSDKPQSHHVEHGTTPRANSGHIPAPPEPRKEPTANREVERDQGGHVNETPHVRSDHWYGHAAPNDDRFRVEHPFEHGHFEHFGPTYRYRVLRVDRDHHRFWFPGGFFFEIADWDWHECADWCWDCGDDFVVYEDPDHSGWYLVYNVHTGVYVHAQYMGT